MIRFIDEQGLISPRGEHVGADAAITAFSTHIFDELIRQSGAKRTGVIKGSVDIDIFTFEADGKRIAVYKSPIGAPAAVSAMEEIMACGVKQVIAFGICGTLIETPPHTFIVPTKAYRDEGTSYHYLPADDFIEVAESKTVASVLSACGISTLSGGTWTTDGFYRETRTRADEMKANGCIAVDMECSALQAAANFRGNRFYTFFITADSLAGEEWQPNDILDLKVTDSTTVAACAAIKLARETVK
ncbi:MAG: nucleoside phosphorylase [Clostridiales bacterium]|nr:nucleoside phosphorylase [Clostridiales bacterium]